jgi:hypothetical protein
MSTNDDTSVEDLKERLVTFNVQLETIELLLTSDPENEELLGIAADLKEVIKLTTDMLNHKLPEHSAVQPVAEYEQYPIGSFVEAVYKAQWCPGTNVPTMCGHDGIDVRRRR